jgi:hypothetical protein
MFVTPMSSLVPYAGDMTISKYVELRWIILQIKGQIKHHILKCLPVTGPEEVLTGGGQIVRLGGSEESFHIRLTTRQELSFKAQTNIFY